MTEEAQRDALADQNAETELERLDRICALKGVRQEDLRVERNDYNGAAAHSRWHAWVKDYDSGCTVGSGSTAESAIDDLLDQLEG